MTDAYCTLGVEWVYDKVCIWTLEKRWERNKRAFENSSTGRKYRLRNGMYYES